MFKLFFELSTFRRPPQDIPYSTNLFYRTFIVYALLNIVNGSLVEDVSISILRTVIGVTYLFVFLYIILQLHVHLNRFMQSATALMGNDFLLNIFLFVFILLHTAGTMSESDLFFLVNILLIWQFAVFSYIFYHATSGTVIRAVLLSMLHLIGAVLLYGVVAA